jgi:hypothetical protein
MRVIIEVEGEAVGVPEVVLRSTQPTPGGVITPGRGAQGQAIDAGPAPAPPDAAAPSSMVTTPMMMPTRFDRETGQSAGAAPSSATEG